MSIRSGFGRDSFSTPDVNAPHYLSPAASSAISLQHLVQKEIVKYKSIATEGQEKNYLAGSCRKYSSKKKKNVHENSLEEEDRIEISDNPSSNN